jgi:hypothetical protein
MMSWALDLFSSRPIEQMRTVRDLDAQSRCLEFVRSKAETGKWPTHLGLDNRADHQR